jgi:small subunit ribosomal protein S20
VANHKSAAKRARQTIKRTERNHAVKSRVRSAVRSFREAVAAGEQDVAETQLAAATRELRKAATKGVFHQRTVSRRVSRLVKGMNAARV